MPLGLRSSIARRRATARVAPLLVSLLALLPFLLSSSPAADAAVLTEIVVSPSGVTMEPQETLQFFAEAVFSDGSRQDITAVAEWTTGDSSTARVSQEHGSRGVVTARDPGTVEIRAALEFGGNKEKGNTVLIVDGGPIVEITTRPSSKNLDVGFAEQFKARATYTRPPGYSGDISDEVTWSSSRPLKATVDATGLVNPIAPTAEGAPVIIRATHTPSGRTNSAEDGATKIKASITHIDFDDDFFDDETERLETVLGAGMVANADVYAYRVDGTRSRVTRDVEFFFFGAPGVIEVLNDGDDPDRDDEAGEITGLSDGIVAVGANFIGRGFSTERPLFVTVSGFLAALEFGSDPFKATVGEQKTAKVFGRLSTGLLTGDLRKLVDWATAKPSIATVGPLGDNDNVGKVTGHKVGTTTLTATEPNTGVSATVDVQVRGAFVDVEVDPEEVVLGVGMILPLKANGIRSDGSKSTVTTQVAWEITPASLAEVDPEGFDIDGDVTRGVLETLAEGVGTIRAVLNPGTADEILSPAVPLTIEGTLVGVRVKPAAMKVVRDQRRKATLEGILSTDTITSNLAAVASWFIADTTKALVGSGDDVPADDPLDRGEVLGLETGVTTLRATELLTGLTSTDEDNLRVQGDVVAVEVDEANGGVVQMGRPAEYKARATFTDGSTSVITDRCEWSSDEESIATVNNTDNKGEVSGHQIGGRTTVRIDCEGLTASGLVEVAGDLIGLEISPETFTGKALRTRQFRAAASYLGGARSEFTDQGEWRSDNPSVATVNDDDDKGQVTFVGDGSAFISVRADTGHVAIATVTVEGGVSEVRIAPNSKTIRGSTGRKLKLVVELSDGDKAVGTKDATWTSSNDDIAYMSDREGEEGIVIGGTQEGTATITGALQTGESGTAEITVETLLTSIEMRPERRTIEMGKHRRVTARGFFTDGRKKSMTRYVEFKSDDPNVAIVQSFGSKPGRVTPLAPGTTTIRAVDPTTGIESDNTTLIEVIP